VNQQRHVCEQIRDVAGELGFGLEAGSKPELLAILGLTTEHPEMLIVCNGFKDDEYAETVVLAKKLGRKIIPVVERAVELKMFIETSARYGVRPEIGLRFKPMSDGVGRWQSSSGIRSKFGLTASQALKALEDLQRAGMADCLKLLHFHIGSQICDIRGLKSAISELAHAYVELSRLGAGLEMIDVGGGLGIDYDGSQSATDSSINYSPGEYASDIVYRIKTACDDAGVAHPTIISESGRAMVAHSSVMIVDVVGSSELPNDPELDELRKVMETEDETPQPVLDLLDAYERLETGPLLELYHDASQAREEAISLFTLGYITLPMRAAAERLFWTVAHGIHRRDLAEGPEDELSGLADLLSDIYYCNFSVFQSMPDSWAIDQVFPICPIHRLTEEPDNKAVMADVTCDSDGVIDLFSGPDGYALKHLDVHKLRYRADGSQEPYYLGIFLVGAYQEVLGDLHNLFGDTNVVHVNLEADGTWSLDEVVEGDTVKEVLEYVQFDPGKLRRAVRLEAERAVKGGRLSVQESASLMRFYESGLDGYTYLE
jgi:arginine decarboxylase